MMVVLSTIGVKRGEDHEQDYDDWAGFGKTGVRRNISALTTTHYSYITNGKRT